MKTMTKKIGTTKGKQVVFADGRCVFVSHPRGLYLIEFKSKEGSITRLALSEGAMHALAVLTTTPSEHDFEIEHATRLIDIGSRWQLAPEQEA